MIFFKKLKRTLLFTLALLTLIAPFSTFSATISEEEPIISYTDLWETQAYQLIPEVWEPCPVSQGFFQEGYHSYTPEQVATFIKNPQTYTALWVTGWEKASRMYSHMALKMEKEELTALEEKGLFVSTWVISDAYVPNVLHGGVTDGKAEIFAWER